MQAWYSRSGYRLTTEQLTGFCPCSLPVGKPSERMAGSTGLAGSSETFYGAAQQGLVCISATGE